jgi:hypothetical protein
MDYLLKTFTVRMPDTKQFKENYDRIFRKKPTKKKGKHEKDKSKASRIHML